MSILDKHIMGDVDTSKTGLVTHLKTKTQMELIIIMARAAIMGERGVEVLPSGELIETKGRALNAPPLTERGARLTGTGCIVVAAGGSVVLSDNKEYVREYNLPQAA
jgi:hypothetical protein